MNLTLTMVRKTKRKRINYITSGMTPMVNQFFDEEEICDSRLHTVTCLASHYVGKRRKSNNEPQNRKKWPRN